MYNYNGKIERLYKVLVEEEKEVYGFKKNDKDIMKNILGNKSNFATFINEFVSTEKNIKPQYLERVMEISDIVKGNFKDIDFIYKTTDEKVYYIVEHQDKTDDAIVYRMLIYTTNILEYIYEKKMLKGEKLKFPQIIPIVIYTGEFKWDSPTKIIEIQEVVNKKIDLFNFTYILININENSDEELKVRKQMIEIMLGNGANMEEINKYTGVSKDKIRDFVKRK